MADIVSFAEFKGINYLECDVALMVLKIIFLINRIYRIQFLENEKPS